MLGHIFDLPRSLAILAGLERERLAGAADEVLDLTNRAAARALMPAPFLACHVFAEAAYAWCRCARPLGVEQPLSFS